jgi:hypothetical protein
MNRSFKEPLKSSERYTIRDFETETIILGLPNHR